MNKETTTAALNKIIATPAIWSVVMLCGVLFGAWQIAGKLVTSIDGHLHEIRSIHEESAKSVAANQEEFTGVLKTISQDLKRLIDK